MKVVLLLAAGTILFALNSVDAILPQRKNRKVYRQLVLDWYRCGRKRCMKPDEGEDILNMTYELLECCPRYKWTTEE